ncbi:MAG: transcription termination/antitermination protein NusA, partial [Lachnoclostridium sp.]|nr:transcription termination/antitermination protein NusA [Lachnoclostridium sp.]
GQNARLAARLTGYKIDIKSETQAKDAPGFRYEDYEYDEDGYDEESYEGYDEEPYEEEDYSDEDYDEESYEEGYSEAADTGEYEEDEAGEEPEE